MFIWDFVADTILEQIMDWVYKQIIGFLANFFAEMGNMGAEMFEMSWVQSIVLFFSYLAWILYAVGFVVACAECGLEYSSGRADIKGTAMNLIKGFMAVSLFSVVPVKLYELCVSLQADFGYAISGAGANFGSVAGNIIDELTVENFVDFATTHVGGFGSVTSPIMVLFCIILMAYGNRNNRFQPYDCATKMAYDYSKVGDKNVQIRNLDTDEVFTYYQADVGALPDAIIDIWGEDNIRELAGTPDGAPTDNANNVRYYHERFSDQTAPAR